MRSRSKWVVTAATLLIWVLLAAAAGAETQVDEALFRKIESNLICTDGCGMYLPACDNSFAQQMRKDIRLKMTEGLAEKEIYAYMISIYGEEVMAAPPPSVPFNITAWVLPFVGILAGGLVIYMALDKWVFYNESGNKQEDQVEAADLAAYDDVLEDEVKKYY
ncbi:MAG: cytochrome c-type biogenesis protein [Bacillota bacterium]